MFKDILNYNNKNSLAMNFRKKRSELIKSIIEIIYSEKGSCSIVDIGRSIGYWDIFSDEFIENKRVSITVLNLEKMSYLPRKNIRVEIGDGTKLDYPNLAFDFCHSNSVVEHIPGWSKKVAFSNEVRRIAARYYVQTPNFYFPFEPHYLLPLFQFLPFQLQVEYFHRFQPGRFPPADKLTDSIQLVEGISLLTKGMVKELFPDGEVINEKFMGMNKSLIAMKI
jgi:hypothetical protein